MPKKKARAKVEAASRGLTPAQVRGSGAPAAMQRLEEEIRGDGGFPLTSYRDPLGGSWQTLAVLPLDKVQPTPFQRDVSPAHVARLSARIEQIDRFLDPVICVRNEDGTYWTPNGLHRSEAMRALGARSITALVVPERELAYQILALNTEKAHNLRERALEAIRMARDLASIEPRPEREYADVFEEPALLTLGICYERKGRFSGSVYHPVLRRVESFQGSLLPKAIATREERAGLVLELDQAVEQAIAKLKERGFESPYLRTFVVARINPLRFQRSAKSADFEETLGKMLKSAERFDAGKVKPEAVARSGGPPEE